MKKLMTMLAAATATVFAFADFTESGTSFENYPTNVLLTTADDLGGGGARFWYSAANPEEAPFVITNYPSPGTGVPTLGAGVTRPEKFKDVANDAFLMIETTDDKRLFRTAESNTQDPAGFAQVDIPENGIYLDTLVKFTAADAAFSSDLTDGDKIAISYVEREEELDSNNNVTVEAATNFVIRAGYVAGGTITQTNYFAAVPAGFDKDAWHRLTVRAIAELGTSGSSAGVGFVVYLDQVPLAYGLDVVPGDAAYIAKFNTVITDNFYKDDLHAIYPSIVDAATIVGKSISSVSFSGNGSVDDVVFTTTTPGFIEATESVVATINLGPGISGVTVSVSGTPVEPADSAANPLVFNLAPGTTDFTLAVTADTANGYTFDDATGITAENASYANGTVTISGGAPTLTLKATRNNFNLFAANGDPIAGTYQTLGEALAATGVAKIQLAHDYDVVAADIETYGYIDLQQSITLDLNGKTLDGGVSVSDPLFMVSDGNFVIIDSVGGGKVVYDGPGIVFGATSYIGATSGDLGPTFDGQLFFDGGEGNIIRGKFDETSNTTSSGDPAFLWEAYLGDGDSVESECTGLVSGYWVVAPKGSGDEDWVPDSSAIPADTSAETQYPALAGTALATADAKQLTDWAKANGVAFSDVKTSADSYVDAFLLNCAVADVDDEKDEFVVNISFDPVTGEPVVKAPTGKTYNGTFKVYGSDDLTTPKASWHEQTDGDTFFYGKLVP